MVGAQPDALGPLLRGFRHVAGMTLEELAEASGVSDRSIGDMERGHSRGPQARTVQALAAALDLRREDAYTLLAAARAGRRLDRLTAKDLRIKSAFTLSYEQLTEDARQLFRRLSLVRGPDFSPALAAALTSFQPGDVERITDELIELGLLNAGSDDRASFHDLVRLYAHQRLNDEESAGRCHGAGWRASGDARRHGRS